MGRLPSATRADSLLLAGDVGRTKTALGILSEDQGSRRPLAVKTYRRAACPELDAVVAESSPALTCVQRACFDVAGRSRLAGQAHQPAWRPPRESALADALGLRPVRLLNDLEAIALGTTQLPRATCEVPHRRKAGLDRRHRGRGPRDRLGEAFLVWTGERSSAYPSEGNHGDLHPGSPGSWSCRAVCSCASAT